VKAVILAAGEGSRMRPLTCNRPKVMLPLANKPILEHLLGEVKKAGISEFIFVVGYCDEQLREYFGNGESWGVSISYCSQRKQLGTADAVKSASHLTLSDDFIVLNGDIIISHYEIEKLLVAGGNAMMVIPVDDTTGLGVVEVAEGKAVQIHEKVKNPPSKLANAGIYKFTPEIYGAIDETCPSPRGEYELTDSLQIMINGGTPVSVAGLNSWTDLSYPWDLLSANQKIMEHLIVHELGDVEENAHLKGDVSFGKNTVIRSGSYIEGPVVIGNNCDIGPNCYIRPNTAIGDNCRIGAAVEIKNSIIMNNTKIPHHNYVGDSVIGERCNLGSGTKIANLRLDKQDIVIDGKDTGRRKLGAIIGDDVETGINSCINTGSVIGCKVRIGPGRVASGVIANNTEIR